MTIELVEEDGSGNPDANTYNSLEELAQYHIDRGNTKWSLISTDDLRATCAIKATDYIDKRFKRFFRGNRQFVDQALGWPRIGAIDDDGYPITDIVPTCIKKAHAEYALRAAIYNVLAPDAPRTTGSQDMSVSNTNGSGDVVVGPLRSKTVKVGPVEKSTSYDGVNQVQNVLGSRSEQSNLVNDFYIPQYPEADLWIEEVTENSTSVELVRA